MRNPYEDAFTQYELYPRPYYHQREYRKPTVVRRQPERYNAARDMNDTARTVVGGAIVIGTFGLLGGVFNR